MLLKWPCLFLKKCCERNLSMPVRNKMKMGGKITELNLIYLCSLSIRIIKALNADELGLFSERIRFLDRKIQPGLSKLHWSTKGTASIFINDCRVHANKVSSFWHTHKYTQQKTVAKQMAEWKACVPQPDGFFWGDLPWSEQYEFQCWSSASPPEKDSWWS